MKRKFAAMSSTSNNQDEGETSSDNRGGNKNISQDSGVLSSGSSRP
jgi:hypothetical protein